MSTPTPVQQQLTWLQRHERIIIAFFVLSLGIWGFNKWVDKSAHDADVAAAVAKDNRTAQDAALQKMQDYIAQQQQQYAADKAAEDAKILSLMTAIANRDAKAAQTITQVQAPKTPTQAVTDLQGAYTNLPAPVTVTDSGATVPTADLQLFTVTKIEHDVWSLDLKDKDSQLTSCQAEVSNDEKMVTDLQGEVKQDQITLNAHDEQAKKDIAQVKANARKSKWHWFWAGVVAGFLARQEIKTTTGM
jgi:hypothetical protein